MKLEERIEKLETALDAMEEQRKIMLFDIFALRAAFVGYATIISNASAAQRAAAKSLAEDRLAKCLLIAGLPSEEATESLATLEDLFYEIDAAQNAADQTPARMS